LLAHIPPQNLRDYYIKTLLPQKVQLDLEYARKASFLNDLLVLFRSALAMMR
jgi:lipopolysaccharide/colanic/teichoic acid biosynthesis glycosyltransferase